MKCWKDFIFFRVSSFWSLVALHNGDTSAESLGTQLGPAVPHPPLGLGLILTGPGEGPSSSHHIPLPGSTPEGGRGTCPFPDSQLLTRHWSVWSHGHSQPKEAGNRSLSAAEVVSPVEGRMGVGPATLQRALATQPSPLPPPPRTSTQGPGANPAMAAPQGGPCCLCWLLCSHPAPHSRAGFPCGSLLLLPLLTPGTPGSQPLLSPSGDHGPRPTTPRSPLGPGPAPAEGSPGCSPHTQQCPPVPLPSPAPCPLSRAPELSQPAPGGTRTGAESSGLRPGSPESHAPQAVSGSTEEAPQPWGEGRGPRAGRGRLLTVGHRGAGGGGAERGAGRWPSRSISRTQGAARGEDRGLIPGCPPQAGSTPGAVSLHSSPPPQAEDRLDAGGAGGRGVAARSRLCPPRGGGAPPLQLGSCFQHQTHPLARPPRPPRPSLTHGDPARTATSTGGEGMGPEGTASAGAAASTSPGPEGRALPCRPETHRPTGSS